MGLVTRRQLLSAAAGVTLAQIATSEPARALSIHPRSSWGSNHPPQGPLDSEEVEFLIVHHSASRNGHTSEDVPGILRSWYNYHTGPEKGWNDVAYNFVIDSEGGIWEARQGSIDGPVAGDATGGNQGFTQLVCVIGDFNQAIPTEAALTSLTQLLAWLADRYGVATGTGSEVTFISRGSNRWPEGTSVTTPTITGHRTMSKTSCPGDNLFSYVVGGLMNDVQAVRGGESSTPSVTSTTSAPSTTASTTKSTSSTASATPSTSNATPKTTTTSVPVSTTVRPGTLPSSTVPPGSAPISTASTPTTVPVAAEPIVAEGSSPLLIGAAALIALGSGLLLWRHNRLRR